MCCLYTLTLSLNLVLPTPVSPIYSCKKAEQIKTFMTLKLLQDIGVFNVNVLYTFLNVCFLDSNWHFLIPTASLLNSTLVTSFLRLSGCRLLLISLMLSNPKTFLLRTLTECLIALYTGGLFELNLEINSQTLCFSFDFLVHFEEFLGLS